MDSWHDELARLFVGSEPSDLPGYVAPLQSGRPYAPGTAVPHLGLKTTARPSGLWVPTSLRPRQPIDFAGTYVQLNQYLNVPPHAVFEIVCRGYPLEDIVLKLVEFNHAISRVPQTEDEINWFIEHLAPLAREKFLRSIAGQPRDRIYLMARHPLLYALKRVMAVKGSGTRNTPIPLGEGCLLLVDAAAQLLTPNAARGRVVFGNVEESVLMDMVRGDVLSRERDAALQLARYHHLWRQYGDEIGDPRLTATPRALFKVATGVEIDLFWALGAALYAFYSNRETQSPLLLADLNSDLPPEQLTAFTDCVAMSLDEARSRLGRSLDPWDYLALQTKPVLRLRGGMVAVDLPFLADRFTSGLYWFVLDHLQRHDRKAAHAWSRAYAWMMEDMVRQQLASVAVPLVGPGADAVAYNEGALQAMYGGKACDLAVDYGDRWLLVEVKKHTISLDTRVHGRFEKLAKEVEQVVAEAVSQLDAVAQNLLRNEAALTGKARPSMRTIIPLIVVAGTFPFEPTTDAYMRHILKARSWLRDPRIHPLAIIELEDLDCLTSLGEQGQLVPDLLRSWKTGSLAGIPFAMWARDHFGTIPYSRRTLESAEQIRREVPEHLKLKDRPQ